MRRPSPRLLDLLADCSPGVTHLALALRELVLTEAPDTEEILYSVYGAELPDPRGLLKGRGKKMRHIRFDSPEELRDGYLRTYIRSAIELVGGASRLVKQQQMQPGGKAEAMPHGQNRGRAGATSASLEIGKVIT